MNNNRTVVHSESTPVYTTNNQTEFLDKFCREKGVEIRYVIGEASDFTNYSVKYNGRYQYTLIHYHSENEEYIFMDEPPEYSRQFKHAKYQ